MIKPPPQPANSFRIVLTLTEPQRIDNLLLQELRLQNENKKLKLLSRRSLKDLFKEKKIRLKGQPALPSSKLAVGVTYVDIMGYE